MTGVALGQLTVAYGGAPAVGPVTRTISRGSWCCFIGPNGAGKTSLLHAIAGLVSYGGAVRVGERSVDRLAPAHRARLVALVPQRPVIPEDMTVAEYTLLGRTPHISRFGVESAADRTVVSSVLTRLELDAFAHRLLGSLSGGELQRAMLARALAQQAPVLLLDEPTSALDLGHQQRVLALVDALRREYLLTVITTMHDLTLAGAHADTLVLLDHGVVVADGPPAEVLDAATLGRYYHADLEVLRATDGTIAVVPVRRR